MEVIHKRCAGLDVHKAEVVACVRVMEGAVVRREVRRFSTTTLGLVELAEWVREKGCTQVGMESTGVYWKPVWHVLRSEGLELVLGNAAHIKNVPGRKSDVKDAEWIADLVAHGLIRPSFVPPPEIAQLRDLTRTRKQLVREIVQHKQRIERVLEEANVKLDTVISDVVGWSGRRMLRAIIAGEQDPQKLAALGSEKLQCSPQALVEALRGKVTAHHRFLLQEHLSILEHLEERVMKFNAQIEAVLAPFREAVERLKTIPGISDTAAQVIVAEAGVDMSRFATGAHLVSWAGLCPGLNESAGKKLSRRLRKGAPWLKTMLVQCAWGATRNQDCYLRAQYLRLKSRRGPKKAVVAVAASMLIGAYHVLKEAVPYRDLGADHFLKHDRERSAQRLTRRLVQLGYEVQIKKVA